MRIMKQSLSKFWKKGGYAPLRIFLALAAWWFFPLTGHATHIVGGEIGYRCLGNNTYEITLRVYRDCYYGAALAPFDDPASIGVFDRNGVLIRNLFVAKVGNDTLTNIIDPCIQNAGTVCVHTTMYRTIIELQPRAGGYHFVYQRCCRNETIQNVVKPLETGATFDILLTEAAMARCNNSPNFRAWPPVFICRDEPFSFNHSATDADGDSLVYKLTVPLQGGTLLFPQPVPPDAPPYDTVVWNNPPGQIIYSVDNMMGFGKQPLIIDPVSGQMSVNPGQLGQFVIGVSVLEYDRQTKKLLSETRRDFQYNVIDCKRVTAAIFAPEAQCDNRTVTFINKSQNGVNGDSFLWSFQGKDFAATATDKNPVFTFPDTGHYSVTLVADPNTLCADTTTHTIFLQDNSLDIAFDRKVVDCFENSFLRIRNTSVDTVSPIIKWEWVLRLDNGARFTSSLPEPLFELPSGLKGTVQLTATSRNGCIRTLEKPLETGVETPYNYFTNSKISACIGQTIGLNAGASPNLPYKYTWSPAEGLSDPHAINPTLLVSKNQQFSVTITPEEGLCDTVLSLTLTAIPQVTASFKQTLQCDGLSFSLRNTTKGGNPARWIIGTPDQPLLDTVATSLVMAFPGSGAYPVAMVTLTECPDTAFQMVEVPGDFQSALPDTAQLVCPNLPTPLNPGGNPGYIYTWTPAAGLSATNSPNPSVTTLSDRTYQVSVTDVSGVCSALVNVHVRVVNFKSQTPPEKVVICPGIPTPLNPNGDPAYTFSWSPATGLSAANVPNPIVTTEIPMVYRVTISDPRGNCDTTVQVAVLLPDFNSVAPPAEALLCPGVPTPINPNGSPLYRYLWKPAAGLSADTAPNPLATIQKKTVYFVQISDLLNQCEALRSIELRPTDFASATPPNALLCYGIPTQLNPNGDPAYKYTWSPATGLSATDIAHPIARLFSSQTYQVKISDPLERCDSTVTVQVQVARFSDAVPVSKMVICPGVPTPLNPNGKPGYQYTWSAHPGLSSVTASNPTFTSSAGAILSLTVRDPLGYCDTTVTMELILRDFAKVAPPSEALVCPGVPTALHPGGDPLYKYSWSPASGLSNPNIPNPVITTQNAQIYQVRISDLAGLCDTVVTVNVRVVRFAEVAPNTTHILCPGVPTALNPRGDARFTYVWSPADGLDNPTAPNPTANLLQDKEYTVKITEPAGRCDTTMLVRIRVEPPANLNAGKDTTLCSLGKYTINATLSNLDALVWSDRPDFGRILGTTQSLQIDLADGVKTYYVKSTSANGCQETDSIRLTVAPLSLSMPAALQACKTGDLLDLTVANGDPRQQLTYTWSPAAVFISDPAKGPDAIIKAADNTLIQVKVSNQYGCTQTLSTAITALDIRSKLTIQGDPTLLRPGGQSVITVNGCSDCTITWNPSTGLNNINGSRVIASPEETTTYTATVSKNGCSDTISITIEVDRCVEPFLPNAFTPNNDGINDVLFVRVKDYDALHLIIYNRWGQEVFDTRNPDIGWDGTFRGRQLPPDIYGFYLEMTCKNGTEFKKKGSISLIR